MKPVQLIILEQRNENIDEDVEMRPNNTCYICIHNASWPGNRVRAWNLASLFNLPHYFLTKSLFEINSEKCFLILHQEYFNEKSCIYKKRASFQGMLRTIAPKHLQIIQSTFISQYCVGMLQCSTRENISGLYIR